MDSSAPNATLADPSAGLPKFPSLDNTFGALLIGCFVGFIQYGLTANQCYTYFRMYPKDIWILKSLVATVLVLETFHSALCMHICYYYLTTNYFNPTALEKGVCFFLRRVWKIGRQYRPLVAVAAVLLLGEFGFATAVTVDTFLHPTLHNSAQAWMNSAGVGMAVLADTILTAALIFSLHQSRTGVRRTDSIIDVLIMYAINTGLVTGIMNLLSLVFALAMPDNLIYAGIVIVATKLYANSMMAVLNSRRSLGTQGTVVHTTSSYDLSAIHRQRTLGSRTDRWRGAHTHRPTSLAAIDVKITRETVHSHPMESLDGFGDESKIQAGEAV
ncbi:hypothetical protein C8Q77DRAFT_1159461 [Trametes polyzona]|nr:hypothetical protein C8Q77DRAFT_1159461 [Trametes polyzona]